MTDEPTVVVGVVTKAHGLRGEVAVEIRSDNPERFRPGARVHTAEGRELTVATSHVHGARTLIRFEEVPDRDAADALRGTTLVVPASWLPELSDDEYWPSQLEGCEVITEAGRDLGTIRDVIANPANDLWVAVAPDGTETLIPAVKEVVVGVDIAAARILVRDVPGLTAPEGDA